MNKDEIKDKAKEVRDYLEDNSEKVITGVLTGCAVLYATGYFIRSVKMH